MLRAMPFLSVEERTRLGLRAAASPVNLQELVVSSLTMSDTLAKILIEKGLITQDEFMRKLSEERAPYQRLLNPTPQ